MPTGDVTAAIRDGLRHCFLAIADTTGNRPNVMYELGMAHGLAKNVVVLRSTGEAGEGFSPFDVRNEPSHYSHLPRLRQFDLTLR